MRLAFLSLTAADTPHNIPGSHRHSRLADTANADLLARAIARIGNQPSKYNPGLRRIAANPFIDFRKRLREQSYRAVKIPDRARGMQGVDARNHRAFGYNGRIRVSVESIAGRFELRRGGARSGLKS